MTTTSPYTGTARYKAYELFRSKNNPDTEITFASDAFALGSVTYEVQTRFSRHYLYHGLQMVVLFDDFQATQICIMLTSPLQFVYRRQPFHDLEMVDFVDAIKAFAPPATKPRILSNTERNLWDLFENCWRPIPEQRISASAAVSHLQRILEAH